LGLNGLLLILPLYISGSMDELLRKAAELTPIEEYDGALYKRDDLFRPFPDEMLNGGKVRQAINLIYHNLDLIKSDYHGKVATTCQKDSPQGMIVSRVAQAYNLGCFVGYGNLSTNTMAENTFIKHIRLYGGTVESIIKQGFDNAITSRLKKLQMEGPGNNFFIIKFGIDVEKNPIVLDCIGDQVQNLPDDLDNLVIPCGSGITTGGILRGIQKYGKKVKKIYVVHVSGMDRRDKINSIAGLVPYIYVKGTGYRYSRKVKVKVSEGFELDQIYEAKAYDWMLHNIDLRWEKTLFWCVGNANYYR
jgi:1-aminocyclopropane-1-carboxylate deaminase/D-cysteine desulfhydrase-like pyridoxal-dependent ACC family enzyme